jgi:hypothetical protein
VGIASKTSFYRHSRPAWRGDFNDTWSFVNTRVLTICYR